MTSTNPTPPFSDPPQDVPGTIAAMDPKPDHGEDSYKDLAEQLTV